MKGCSPARNISAPCVPCAGKGTPINYKSAHICVCYSPVTEQHQKKQHLPSTGSRLQALHTCASGKIDIDNGTHILRHAGSSYGHGIHGRQIFTNITLSSFGGRLARRHHSHRTNSTSSPHSTGPTRISYCLRIHVYHHVSFSTTFKVHGRIAFHSISTPTGRRPLRLFTFIETSR